MSYPAPKPVPSPGPGAAAIRHYGTYDLFGNNNYQQTGDLYNAQQFGMGGIEFVDLALRSHSGNFVPGAVPPANASNSVENVAPCFNNFTLHWYSANGTEVANNTNLAAEIVRVQLFGV